MRQPEISCILPTRNRAELLSLALSGIWRQSLPFDHFEIILVDDGSTDATSEVVAAFERILPLRLLRQAPAGIAAAKSLGVFASRAPIVLFMDDDDIPDSRMLEAHLEAHRRHPDPRTAILGHTGLAPAPARSPLMRYVTEVGCQLFAYPGLKAGEVLDYRGFWGGRSSCKRDFLLHRGLFNADFTFGCEDVELGWRLQSFGLQVIYEPAARATMLRTLDFDGFCNRSIRQGRAQWRFHSLHQVPEIRSYCEIDSAAVAWASDGPSYDRIIRETRRLDQTAAAYISRDVPLDRKFLAALNRAYDRAFTLSRARGIAEARHQVVQP